MFSLPVFFMISRHSPENCPMFNEKAREVWLEYINKSEQVLTKYGAKAIGAWSVPSEHLSYWVYEIPSLDIYQKLGMEPEILAVSAFETYEIKLAYNMDEITQMLQQTE